MNKDSFKRIMIPTIISSIVIMILHNFAFVAYDKYFIIPIFISIITYLYIVNDNDMIVNEKGYIYLIPIVLIITGTVLLNTHVSNMILNVFILPILITCMFLKLTNKNYHISSSFMKWTCKLFPDNLFSNLKLVTDNINIKKNNKKKLGNILKGLLIGIPFVLIILMLLTSADLYFNTFLEKIITHINFKTITNNVLVLVLYFIIMIVTIINIIKNKDTIEKTKPIKKVESSIASTLLIMVNLVFTLFIISEISKLTGNFLQLPTQYTYSEYAREGFFQLLAVTIINFSIILFFLYKTNIVKENKLIKGLILLLITFTIILIFNSYYRMYLYMHEFGFTILRTQVILYLIMELILLIVIIKKLFTKLKFNESTIFPPVMITTYVLNILICNKEVIDLINRLINKG